MCDPAITPASMHSNFSASFKNLCMLVLLSFAPVPGVASSPSCVQCGDWHLQDASLGTSGEVLTVTQDQVLVPGLGGFCARELAKPVSAGSSSDDVTMTFHLGAGCDKAEAPDSIMEMRIGAMSRVEHSRAEFKITHPTTGEVLFSATGWHVMRDAPCDSGSGSGSYACLSMVYAESAKRLMFKNLELRRGSYGAHKAEFAKRFDPIKFLVALARSCHERTIERGTSDWDAYWNMSCQVERINAKARELHRWDLCTTNGKKRCKVPDMRFDKKLDPNHDRLPSDS